MIPYFFDRVMGHTLKMVQVRDIISRLHKDAHGLALGRSKIHQASVSPESQPVDVLLQSLAVLQRANLPIADAVIPKKSNL